MLCAKSGQAWSALAEIGRQLQILADAQKGEGDFSARSLRIYDVSDVLTLTELTNEFLRAKARAGRCDRYLRALRYSLVKFSLGRGARPVTEITVHEIENWLHDLNLQPRTLKGYLGDVRTLFNFGVRRNYLQRNPAAGVELPVCEPAPPSLHAPETVRTVLEFASFYDLDICRALAVRYFAGLRTAEVERVGEDALREDFLEVSAALCPRLRRTDGGCWNSCERWPHNVTRHSFCSYHLAKFQNAGKTALESGHTEQVLFSNYREMVTPRASEEFWESGQHSPVNKTVHLCQLFKRAGFDSIGGVN